jgi:hypothetical protein
MRHSGSKIFGAAFSLISCLLLVGGATAQELKGGPACPLGNPDDVCFGMPPAPSVIRQLNYDAPGSGQVLVMVNGSGFCSNFYTEAEEIADFSTQIDNRNSASVDHRGPGGLRFYMRLPRATQPFGGNIIVPINFSASRVFPVKVAGKQRFYLKLSAAQVDAHVSCSAYALNMTVLFTPD